MKEENAVEVPQTEQVNPVPAITEAPKAEVTAPVSEPTESPVEVAKKKEAAAFIRMRQENRELKRKLAMATPAPVPPAVEAHTPVQPTSVATPTPTAPAQLPAVNDIEEESKKAIESLAMDKDVSGIPGSMLEIIDMVDSDPRLSRLHNIDPVLAFREAKGMYLSKAGISPAPQMPKPTAHAAGTGGGNVDLNALIAKADSAKPGTKEWYDLTKRVDAELKKHGF